MRGAQFVNQKILSAQISKKDHQKFIRDYIPIKNSEEINWEITHSNPDQAMLVVNLSLKLKNQFRMLGESIAISPFPIYTPSVQKQKNRTDEIRINYPIYKTDSITLDLPFINQYQVKLPQDTVYESCYGSFEATYRSVDNTILINRSFTLRSGDYPKEEYAAFYAFMKSIEEFQTRSFIVLNPT